MSGIMGLVLAQARRERAVLPVWILGIAFLGFVITRAVAAEFADGSARMAIINVAAANPAFLFIRGLPDGTGIGAVTFFQGYAFTAVLAALMSTFLVTRNTRADEELGRGELVGALPVRRADPLVATLVLGAAANLVLAGCVAAGFAAAGLARPGALMAGAAVGAVGAFFVAASAAVAQVMPSGRSTNGAAAGLVGASYLLRGVGDALGTPNADLTRVTGGWVSLLSPIGWGQRTRPFSVADPMPLLVLTAATVMTAVAVVVLRSRRDLGSSLLPERTGRERVPAGGASFLGLAWRQQRATLAGWCVAAVLLGGVAGGLGPVVTKVISGNESLGQVIARLVPGSQAEIIDVFTTALLGMAGLLSAAAGIQAVLRLRAEETEGRAELLLAVPPSRLRWLGANLVLAVASVALVALVSGTAATIGLALSGAMGEPSWVLVAAALAHVPAAVVFVAAATVLFAAVPRLCIPLGWGTLAAGLVLGQFGELLRLPAWLQDLSPFRHSPAMPVEPFDSAAALTLTAVALAGTALSAYLFRRRELTP
ncbi:exporter of polyketide antibiotics [Arthrobacter sp. MN05-02]|nr:exporter of polyketide antibiotics [Arthrobacter sp. MN05-02]